MTWQITIILQIIVSSFMTLFTRQLTLSTRKVFFAMGVLSYITVACAGVAYALLHSHGGASLFVPAGAVWPLLLIEGVCIPAAWLIQYKVISNVGAGNAMIVTTLNTLGTALMGVLFLNEPVTFVFACGAVLVLGGVSISLRIRPDTKHQARLSFIDKFGLTISGAVLFASGMFAEKLAVNSIGPWDYALFGWSMQAVGAITLFALFGRSERVHINRTIVGKGFVLGALTSVAGILYIYALSKGTLSQTIIATSGKTAFVMLFAAIFMYERNAIPVRIAAFALTMAGLWLVIA